MDTLGSYRYQEFFFIMRGILVHYVHIRKSIVAKWLSPPTDTIARLIGLGIAYSIHISSLVVTNYYSYWYIFIY